MTTVVVEGHPSRIILKTLVALGLEVYCRIDWQSGTEYVLGLKVGTHSWREQAIALRTQQRGTKTAGSKLQPPQLR